MEKGSSHENSVSCENEKDQKEGEEFADEKEEEKSLEKKIEETLEEKFPVDQEKGLEKKIEEKLEEKLPVDEEEKSLEKKIEEKLEEKLPVDVHVKRRGPILWISTGKQLQCSILATFVYHLNPYMLVSESQKVNLLVLFRGFLSTFSF